MGKSNGGFQAFGLRKQLLTGIIKKGYKVPTAIQKKAIPPIIEGKDVIGMSRTGSGKTLAFVLPCFERLFQLEGKTGIKALVLAPTRELAHQIYRVFKEVGRYTNFKYHVIYGGDSMEGQFAKMLDFPDVVIATPGRLLHLLVEMDMKLSSVEYVVFDEADRLFELGFHEQLMEILHRLPEYRQTLLFSATLPQQLVDFAKAGLNEPELIRLDVENTLPEKLRNVFIGCRFDDKMAVLLALLKHVIFPGDATVVFVPTRHHVEYVRQMLKANQIRSTFVFSALDQRIRVENVRRFKSGEVNVLIVTDVAARGIDIPLLDNVINFNFPAKPKLFVHRVGRVARAGREGCAYSILSSDELSYLHELNMFLGRTLTVADEHTSEEADHVYGSVPQDILDDENDSIRKILETNKEVQENLKVCTQAYQQFLKTREKPSSEAVRQMKHLYKETVPSHPVLATLTTAKGKHVATPSVEMQQEQQNLLQSIKNFKAKGTIFEVDRKKQKANEVVTKTRKFFEEVIRKKQHQNETEEAEIAFEKEIESSKTKDYRDDEYYLPHQSKDHHTEKGLAVNSGHQALEQSVFSVMGDEKEDMRTFRLNEKRWDRKKKKFVGEADEMRAKKFKTENGNWISTSYKSDAFKKWKERNKIADTTVSFDDDQNNENSSNDKNEVSNNRKLQQRNKEVMRMMSSKFKKNLKGAKSELKDKAEIVKQRVIKQRHDKYQEMKDARKKQHEKKTNKRSRTAFDKNKSRGGRGGSSSRGGSSQGGKFRSGKPGGRAGGGSGRGRGNNKFGGKSSRGGSRSGRR